MNYKIDELFLNAGAKSQHSLHDTMHQTSFIRLVRNKTGKYAGRHSQSVIGRNLKRFDMFNNGKLI